MTHYTIVGAGKSGIAAALLAQKKGSNVFLTETKTAEQLGDTVQILTEYRSEAVERHSSAICRPTVS